jgi:hypothetical protein
MTRLEELTAVARELPEEALETLVRVAEELRARRPASPPFTPVALGGIAKGIDVSAEDIAEARREMWGRFGDP